MRCPTVDDLPSPPPGKRGWPWTEGSKEITRTMSDRSPWPKVCIVTPSYNQADFLEETIRSVLLQAYPNLHYIIIDGGSTDGSVEIIRKYAHWLAYWVSEPDKGQSAALNKGFTQATGEIIGWLNSDDLYCSGAIGQAVTTLMAEKNADVVYGGCHHIDRDSHITNSDWAMAFDPYYPLYSGPGIRQQTLFWRRALMEKVGLLDENLAFCMDRDFIIRLVWNGTVTRTTAYLGMFRHHEQGKTARLQEIHKRERLEVQLRYRHYHQTKLPPWFWRVRTDVKRWLWITREAGWAYAVSKIRRRIQSHLVRP
jgi:glycosyltransferase involved in cell wall biosynthesis